MIFRNPLRWRAPRKVVHGIEYVQIGSGWDSEPASFDLDGRHYPPGSWLRIVPGEYSTALTDDEFTALQPTRGRGGW